ncbi:MAG: hypothetical protein PUK16_01460 [Prevotellaceae bacterium]|nr:hypothetical protein [Prevotellaceae bacterium]
MKKILFSVIFMVTMFCGNLSAANWVTVTTAKGNVFHIDTTAFENFQKMMDYVWETSEGLDKKYPDGSYNR